MHSIRHALVVTARVLGACDRSETPDIPPASLILINADVVTVDPELPNAEAVAIQADRILAVGTSSDMLEHRGEATEIIDLAGQMVMPGFIEGHGH